ncbi:hypothetical protein SAMN06265350_11024 [Solitalea koreensis]|uniref:Uncharacterized protein n=1 Tax=Solitalea koreensis TaxID=543615 RepID=A0A521E198_9SPHI|nr:hypothetical protein SAMN06265350_11024 [Solitalea koreensis]
MISRLYGVFITGSIMKEDGRRCEKNIATNVSMLHF